MNIQLLGALLLASFVFESTIIGAPLVFIFSLLIFRRVIILSTEKSETDSGRRKDGVGIIVFLSMLLVLSGFVIDALRLNQPGSTSIMLILAAIVILFYTLKFEMKHTSTFVVLFVCLTILYAVIMGYSLLATISILGFLIGARIVVYLISRSDEKNRARIW